MHQNFLKEYCANHNIYRNKSFDDILITYPNFMITNINYYKNNKLIQDFLNTIVNNQLTEKLEMGDANIWGIAIDYLDNIGYFIMKNIQYHHHSHQKMVYGTTNEQYGYMPTNWP